MKKARDHLHTRHHLPTIVLQLGVVKIYKEEGKKKDRREGERERRRKDLVPFPENILKSQMVSTVFISLCILAGWKPDVKTGALAAILDQEVRTTLPG